MQGGYYYCGIILATLIVLGLLLNGGLFIADYYQYKQQFL